MYNNHEDATDRIQGRSYARLGQNILAGVMLAAAAAVFVKVGGIAPPSDRPTPTEESAASGQVVRVEALDLWLPGPLNRIARLAGGDPRETKAAVRAFLDAPRLTGTWYALTLRLRQANGRASNLTHIKHVDEKPGSSEEFLATVAAIRGKGTLHHAPNSDPRWRAVAADFSNTTIRIIPEDVARWEPHQAIVELLCAPTPPIGDTASR